MIALDIHAVADELLAAYAGRRADVIPFSAREAGLDLSSAYAIERELRTRRIAAGRRSVGRKVGYANKAVWRVFKLDTVVSAHMYDDTVRYAQGNSAALPLAAMIAPKIEPEIVFTLKSPLPVESLDAAGALQHVEWIALGFEIIDCVFKDWQFQPADFVAAYGLHAALIVGDPLVVDADRIPALVDELSRFTVKLARNGQVVAEGSGRNSLKSPALCLAELAASMTRQPTAEPLSAGELISSGTLTESQPLGAGDTWTASVDGIALPPLTVSTTS